MRVYVATTIGGLRALRSNGFSDRRASLGVPMSAATRSAVAASSWSAGTAAEARPIATASCAPTNRPVAQISSARE